MSTLVLHLRGWRPPWHTRLVGASVVVLVLALGLSSASLAPMVVTTVAALVGGVGFVLGVSASISAFLDRDAYADSDFWR